MRSMGCFMALKFGIWMLAFNGLFKYSACKIVQGLSPYLPFMISRESSKVNFQSSFLHFFHCVFSVLRVRCGQSKDRPHLLPCRAFCPNQSGLFAHGAPLLQTQYCCRA